MLKGLVRCSACGGTLTAGGVSGKARVPCLQCCNYAKGSCHTSHGITVPKIEAAFIQALRQAAKEKNFKIIPREKKQTDTNKPDFDKLIAVEERRLARAKEAYLAEIDTIEQYARNKAEIIARIQELTYKRDEAKQPDVVDVDVLADRVLGIVDLLERESVTPSAKNEAIRTIVEKVVFEKANGNLAIYFHDL
jgi:hypothetical protein